MPTSWVRCHANGIDAYAVHVGGAWLVTVGDGATNVVCPTLAQALARADERVASTFSHDCLASRCPLWRQSDAEGH